MFQHVVELQVVDLTCKNIREKALCLELGFELEWKTQDKKKKIKMN